MAGTSQYPQEEEPALVRQHASGRHADTSDVQGTAVLDDRWEGLFFTQKSDFISNQLFAKHFWLFFHVIFISC